MDLHPVDILINIINIAVLFILLRVILWKPVNKYLSSRAERVKKELQDADNKRREAEALRQEYKDNLDSIEAQARDVMRESRAKASEEADEILDDAREKSREMILEARERIADERERAVDNARREVARLATDMASRILKREVLPEDDMSAVEEFFSEQR